MAIAYSDSMMLLNTGVLTKEGMLIERFRLGRIFLPVVDKMGFEAEQKITMIIDHMCVQKK
jgi:hypothetical protein